MAGFNTRKVRFSYPHLFEKDKNDRYSLEVLIPKTDKETMEKIVTACKAVYEEHRTDIFKGMEWSQVNKPYHDGDGTKPRGGSYGPEAKGHYVMSTNTTQKVKVVDINRQIVQDEEKIYPGVYGRVNINFSAYNVNGSKGIKCYLNGVQTYGYGDRIGNYFDSETGFDDGFEDDDLPVDDDLDF